MKQYDSYKDSGVEWIGKIPSHWESMPLKRYGKFNKGLSFTKADLVSEGKPVVSYGQVHSKLNKGTSLRNELIRFVPDSIANSEASLVKKGDFIFADTSEDLDGSGNVVYNDTSDNVYGGYHTVLFQTKNNDNKYLAYLFTTDCWRSQIRSRVGGVKVYSITQYILGLSSIILPPLAEQKNIALYLDEQTSRIDNIIYARENKIKLLEELRTAIISKAVTKGIRKNVEFKDSGIEWIGRIPKHWEKCPLKWLVKRIGSGKTPLGGAEVYTSEGIMFIRSQNVYNEGLLTENIAYIPEIIHRQMLYSEVKHNDILLNITGGSIGRACLIQDGAIKANVNQHVCEIRPIVEKIYPQFLHYTIISSHIQNEIRACQTGGNRDELNFEQISNFIIPLPPIDEQIKICSLIFGELQRISKMFKECNDEIALLKEYRSSLITEVVTGKRKVI